MDTQTTALTAIITSLVFLASPEPKPQAKMTKAQAAMAVIEESTAFVDKNTKKMRLKTNERPATLVP